MSAKKTRPSSAKQSRTKPAIVISTYPTKKSASDAANGAVRLKLAACVNMTRISSTYSWKGKVENAQEYLAIFKTTPKNKNKLKDHIRKAHPYEVPEIAELEMSSVNAPYMKWLADSVL